MKILIIGAAGMLGRKLVGQLVSSGELAGRPVNALHLVDVVGPHAPPGWSGSCVTEQIDLSTPGVAEALIARRPDCIFHLAAIVSGEAEADFQKGYRINLDGTRQLFDAIAGADEAYCPRVVFTSSIAVFGAPFPERIGDTYHTTPLTSYGTQKAMGELLLNDYSRRGLFDGVGLRMPTVCVRPGRPNAAASGFFSNIIREPIHGKPAVLPVDDSVRHWFVSPRAAVGFLVQAASMPGESFGDHRILSLPGLSATVAEQIEALRQEVGSEAVALIEHTPDETIRGIVKNWPQNFDTPRARELGFTAESTFNELVQVYLKDDAPEYVAS